jgi:hypothetical protein
MDGWSDPTVFPYVALTLHWTEILRPGDSNLALRLRTELGGFVGLPVSHTGEHLAFAAIGILDRLEIAEKVCWFFCHNNSRAHFHTYS